MNHPHGEFHIKPLVVVKRALDAAERAPDRMHTNFVRQGGDQFERLPLGPCPIAARMLPRRPVQAYSAVRVLLERDVVSRARLAVARAETIEFGTER